MGWDEMRWFFLGADVLFSRHVLKEGTVSAQFQSTTEQETRNTHRSFDGRGGKGGEYCARYRANTEPPQSAIKNIVARYRNSRCRGLLCTIAE